MALQFGTIATIVTGLVEGAKLLSAGVPAKEPPATSDKAELTAALKKRVTALESHEADQALLVEQLAEQLKELAAAGDRLSTRAMMFFVASGVALLFSLISLVLVLLWR